MPVDLEMFLSASRQNLFDFSTFPENRYSVRRNGYRHQNCVACPRNHFLVGNTNQRPVDNQKKHSYHNPSKPKAEAYLAHGSTRKKKVSFADDKGLNLLEVREIPGDSRWTDDVLNFLMGNVQKTSTRKVWRTSRGHPPWEEEEMMRRLGVANVILESANVLKDPEDVLVGTIRVKNMAYEKSVFVRVTFDRWVSHNDVRASYVNSKTGIADNAVDYDTFRFRAKITPLAVRCGVVEFCVCFKSNGREYWDNNGGVNYRLVAETLDTTTESVLPPSKDNSCDSEISLSFSDHLRNFSEIDAWGSFMFGQPYW